jgi:ATP-binding cassette subfamily C protein
MTVSFGASALLADFLKFARARSVAAVSLIVTGALLEGIGIMMLVPILALILGVSGSAEQVPMVEAIFANLGLDAPAQRVGAVLVAFAIVLGLRFIVILARDDLLERLMEDFVLDLRARAFSYLACAPWAEVAGVRQGPVSHALTRDVDRVLGGVGLVVAGCVSAVMIVVQISLALALAPMATILAATLGLGLFRLLRPLRNRAALRGKALTNEDLAMFQTVTGFLRGLKPAKVHGLESAYTSAFERASGRIAKQNRAFVHDHVLARLILQTASGGVAIVVLLLGLFVLDSPPENLIVTLIILTRLSMPVQMLQSTIQGIRYAAAGYQATRALADTADRLEVRLDKAPAEPLDQAPEIALAGVSWLGSDLEQRPVLDAITARIPSGQVTALIGDSGAGKSTFCDMAVGLLSPDSGDVRIDGASLDSALAARLRMSVAYVGQEPYMIEESLRYNLCWGCGPRSDAEIWSALEIVGAASLARALDGGLDGSMRAEGTRFSGGERQRLRLARALLRRPRFLVLDEATNALDLEAEARVLGRLLAARDGATVLMVSHRPGILHLADHVILLDRGRLAETGAVAALAKNPASRVGALLALGGFRDGSRDGSGAAPGSSPDICGEK